ncbi:hypothetical protein Leryth_013724, partial [Lithospermum erythrorhizon]
PQNSRKIRTAADVASPNKSSSSDSKFSPRSGLGSGPPKSRSSSACQLILLHIPINTTYKTEFKITFGLVQSCIFMFPSCKDSNKIEAQCIDGQMLQSRP